jgi:hypothetical protein
VDAGAAARGGDRADHASTHTFEPSFGVWPRVGGLEIAMDDELAVRVLDRLARVLEEAQALLDGKPAFVAVRRQRLSIDAENEDFVVRVFTGSVSDVVAGQPLQMAGTVTVLISAFGDLGEYNFSATGQ